MFSEVSLRGLKSVDRPYAGRDDIGDSFRVTQAPRDVSAAPEASPSSLRKLSANCLASRNRERQKIAEPGPKLGFVETQEAGT